MGSLINTDPYSYYINPANYKTYGHELPLPVDSVEYNFIYQVYGDKINTTNCNENNEYTKADFTGNIGNALCTNLSIATQIQNKNGVNLGKNQNMNDAHNIKMNELLKTFNLTVGIIAVSYLTFIDLKKYKWI